MNNYQKQQFKGTILVVDDTPDNLGIDKSRISTAAMQTFAKLKAFCQAAYDRYRMID
jgi:hypothetical protein